ncbi:MAG: hypothetical protein AAF927_17135 [Bacteroidota bacterium]
MNKLFIVISSVIQFLSCSKAQNQMECLNQALLDLELDQMHIQLKSSISDSIISWKEKGLRGMDRFEKDQSNWEVDGFFLNEDSTRLFAWVLLIDNSVSGEKLDFIKYFAGEKRGEDWFFYLHHMPNKVFDREINYQQKNRKEELAKIARKSVIDGGIFVGSSCKVNYSYIDEWLSREDRDFLNWHKQFLLNRSP